MVVIDFISDLVAFFDVVPQRGYLILSPPNSAAVRVYPLALPRFVEDQCPIVVEELPRWLDF